MRFLLLLALALVMPAGQPALFDRQFTGRTLRVDYFHTGGPRSGETFALDAVVNDGPWPGSRTALVDDTNLGQYRFEVRSAAGALLYSRGYGSIYGEWETTAEAKSAHRTFHESLRFPWPREPVTVIVQKRQPDNRFADVWQVEIDPSSRFVNTAPPGRRAGQVVPILENGPASAKVDLLVVSEGYTAAQMPKFRADAKRLIEALFAEEPFRSRRADFNVRALELPSTEPGIHRPNAGVSRRTPLGTQYNVFDSERYMLTLDNRALRDAASAAPYEFIQILANERTYGGGGVFNAHAAAAADSAFAEYLLVHEFAHHFAALGDEYYTSDVAYETGVTERAEPWEPNITALKDPASLKWRDLVTPGTPLPTPWEKAAFEQQSAAFQERRRDIRTRNAPEEEMEALFREQQEFEQRFLAAMEYGQAVGAFEGASYEARGLYRPRADCIMFSRNPVGFCPVCQRGLTRVIDLYSR